MSHSFSELPAPSAVNALDPLLGASPAMQEVLRLIERVGPTDTSVLLTGESGSGKDIVARWIHDKSTRIGKPFIVINCGAIPAGLIEAELFGSAKGSITGATGGHAGAFERAHGGTVLLDEVTEMPLDMQTRLLRSLETRKYYRIGASTEYTCDVRIIAATNRCPLQAVQNGLLREDLLYRLAAFPIDLPPLRNRGDDVVLLAAHFIDALNGQSSTQKQLSAAANLTLKQHPWPGNVRELRNAVERAFMLGDQLLELAPLMQSSTRSEPSALDPHHNRERLDIRVGSRIDDVERSLIEATLDYFKGNKKRAADVLGCSLKTLYNKLNGYSQSQQLANT